MPKTIHYYKPLTDIPMPIKLKIASTPDELSAAYRLRYEGLMGEHGPELDGLDHTSREIKDSLDDSSRTVIAIDGNRVVGTQRITLGKHTNLGTWIDFFEMQSLGELFPKFVSMSSRMVVDSKYRNTTLPLRLAVRSYQEGNKLGSCVDFMYCRKRLVPFFERFGYVRWCQEKELDGVGLITPMVLFAHQQTRLSEMRSPFAKHAPTNCSSCCEEKHQCIAI